ncbi:hypothetical protein [Parapedobacter sp. 10938]|uniref:hypothetical protein n=1 Tax=Parapedobacter flavus TaxID=3110225 RepID=UPI002DBB74CB|nr:hypothetical protein [Parapedobacter sp. 10938]MEC3880166.1 hypothetical protein [Parapedobacter sp. 10938]
MINLKFSSVLFLFAIFMSSCSTLKSQNISLNKKPTISTAPNYKLTGNNPEALTDGFETQGNKFWQRETSLGWTKVNEIIIDIDLKQDQNVESVSFNTARGSSAEVNYPKHVFLFLSNDKKQYTFCGDIVKNDSNVPGGYKVTKFTLEGIGLNGRYAKLFVIPQGKYVFCDEVQFFGGERSNRRQSSAETIPSAEISSFVNDLIVLDQTQSTLNTYLERAGIKDRVMYSNSTESSASTRKRDLESSYYDMRRTQLRSRFKETLLVNKLEIWKDDLFGEVPDKNDANLVFNLNLLKGGTQYGGFQITNTSDKPSEVILSTQDANSAVEIRLFSLPTIVSKNNQFLSDPLLELSNNRKIAIAPGRSEIIGFSVKGLRDGVTSPKIIIKGVQREEVTLNVRVVGDAVKTNELLNANVWAYLDYPLLKNRAPAAIKDLENHHINTTVVRAKYIPNLNSKDFISLKKYISQFSQNNNILLFINWQNKKNWTFDQMKFMSDGWKSTFKDWYLTMLQSLEKEGYKSSQVFWYPYDEVNGDYINELIEFSKWAKSEIPSLQLFATVMNKSGAKIIPYVDIAQIKEILVAQNNLKPRKQLWIYEVIEDASDKSPLKDYRQMVWKAFFYNSHGVGFWNYADNRKTENPITRHHSDLDRDYTVIYTGSGGEIVSSRRWEAFKLGIEDYQLLNAHSEKFGLEATKKKISRIFNTKNGFELIGPIREEIFDDIYKSTRR